MQHLIASLREFGLTPANIDIGKISRADHNGCDSPGKKSGWYVVNEWTAKDGRVLQFGTAGCWKCGAKIEIEPDAHVFRREDNAELIAHRKQLEAQVAAERARIHAEAAERAVKQWAAAKDTGTSPYLARKGVRNYGLRYDGADLLVPMWESCNMVGLQRITPDGKKRFSFGCKKLGACHCIGRIDDAPVIAICEGYATAASVHEATDWPVVVAFDAGNLGPVANALRHALPDVRIVLAGDDDHATAGNPGRTKAEAAARAVSGLVALPTFRDCTGRTDWNDLHATDGAAEVRRQLTAAVGHVAQEPAKKSRIQSATELMAAHKEYRPYLIEDYLREGEICNIIAAPKIGKSYLVLQLAYCLSNGEPWFGKQCSRGNVLVIDNELHAETIAMRLRAVQAGLQEQSGPRATIAAGGISVVNLRGHIKDIVALSDQIVGWVDETKARVVVLDALYRLLPKDASENDNSAIMQVFNALDGIAQKCGAAIIVIHHSSKGEQGGKQVTDRGAGAGSFARSADTHMSLSPHDNGTHVVLEAVTRSSKQPAAMSIRRSESGAWVADTAVAPVVRQGPAKQGRPAATEIVSLLEDEPLTLREIQAEAEAAGWALSREVLARLLASATRDGQAHPCKRGQAQAWSLSPAEDVGTVAEAVMAILDATPDMPPAEIARRCNTSKRTVFRIKKQMGAGE